MLAIGLLQTMSCKSNARAMKEDTHGPEHQQGLLSIQPDPQSSPPSCSWPTCLATLAEIDVPSHVQALVMEQQIARRSAGQVETHRAKETIAALLTYTWTSRGCLFMLMPGLPCASKGWPLQALLRDHTTHQARHPCSRGLGQRGRPGRGGGGAVGEGWGLANKYESKITDSKLTRMEH